MIPPKKHRQALTRLHETSRLNFTKKADSDFIDYIDEVLRIAMAQLRVLKQSPVAKERAYKKATACEKETLDDMLSGLALTKEEGEENAPDEERAPTLTLAVWAEQPGSSSQKVPLSPSTVFGRVLAKKDSSESEDGRETPNPTAKPGFMSGLMNLSTLFGPGGRSPPPGLQEYEAHQPQWQKPASATQAVGGWQEEEGEGQGQIPDQSQGSCHFEAAV